MGVEKGERFERLDDVVVSLDSRFQITECNDGAEALFGCSEGEIVGRVFWDAIPDFVATQIPDSLHSAIDDGDRLHFETYHSELDRWFDAYASPASDGLTIFMFEATERIRRAHRQAQQAGVLEAVNEGVITLDSNHAVASINRSLLETFGVDRADVVDEHVEVFTEIAGIDDDGAVAIGRAIGDIERGAVNSSTVELEYTTVADERRVGELRMVPVEAGPAEIAGVVRDVTEQREYERLVAALHELTRWLLGSTDPEEICAIAVHAGSELLDLPVSGVWLLEEDHGTLDPVAGTARTHDEYGGLRVLSQGEDRVWSIYETGEPTLFEVDDDSTGVFGAETDFDSEIVAPIGVHGVFAAASTESRSFTETDLELVATLSENTRAALDRAERERTIERRTAELERLTSRLEAVADVLSGEIQGKLDAVATTLQERDSNDRSDPRSSGPGPVDVPEWIDLPAVPEEFDDALTALEHADRLVEDVREFARSARRVTARERIRLEVAIEDAVNASAVECASVVIEDAATLRADPDRFAHMLETVFDDAAARTRDELTVQVGLLGVEASSSGARGFYVLDDGEEIPPSTRERVFEPGDRPRGETTGLGLAVARVIAEAHDWSVSITTGENGGTKFEVRDVTTLEPT